MTASRSFSPVDGSLQGEDDAAPPVFPLLPYAFTAYAEHCSRDVADQVNRLRDRLDEVLFGYQDFGMVGRKNPHP